GLKIRAGGGEQVKEWTAHATELGWAATDYEGKPWNPRSRGTPRIDGVEKTVDPEGHHPIAREQRRRHDRQAPVEQAVGRLARDVFWARVGNVGRGRSADSVARCEDRSGGHQLDVREPAGVLHRQSAPTSSDRPIRP